MDIMKKPMMNDAQGQVPAQVSNQPSVPQQPASPQGQPPPVTTDGAPVQGQQSDFSEEYQNLILQRLQRLEPGDVYALLDGIKSEEAVGVLAAIVPEISPILAQILQIMGQRDGGQQPDTQGQPSQPNPEPQQAQAQQNYEEQPENPILRDGPTSASKGLLG